MQGGSETREDLKQQAIDILLEKIKADLPTYVDNLVRTCS